LNVGAAVVLVVVKTHRAMAVAAVVAVRMRESTVLLLHLATAMHM
jgi:hypothetical protein